MPIVQCPKLEHTSFDVSRVRKLSGYWNVSREINPVATTDKLKTRFVASSTPFHFLSQAGSALFDESAREYRSQTYHASVPAWQYIIPCQISSSRKRRLCAGSAVCKSRVLPWFVDFVIRRVCATNRPMRSILPRSIYSSKRNSSLENSFLPPIKFI